MLISSSGDGLKHGNEPAGFLALKAHSEQVEAPGADFLHESEHVGKATGSLFHGHGRHQVKPGSLDGLPVELRRREIAILDRDKDLGAKGGYLRHLRAVAGEACQCRVLVCHTVGSHHGNFGSQRFGEALVDAQPALPFGVRDGCHNGNAAGSDLHL